jgi:hypothetical protein
MSRIAKRTFNNLVRYKSREPHRFAAFLLSGGMKCVPLESMSIGMRILTGISSLSVSLSNGMCISVVAGGVKWYILVEWWEIVVYFRKRKYTGTCWVLYPL